MYTQYETLNNPDSSEVIYFNHLLFYLYHFTLYLYVFLFTCLFFSLCGISDSPQHSLTVILAPGSADIDCQRDVSFLLFISSSLWDAAECKSAFSPWRAGRTVVVVGVLQERRVVEADKRDVGRGDKTCREGAVGCGVAGRVSPVS